MEEGELLLGQMRVANASWEERCECALKAASYPGGRDFSMRRTEASDGRAAKRTARWACDGKGEVLIENRMAAGSLGQGAA